jgi:cytochrome P450
MLAYNPFSEEAIADPFPIYRRLRDEAPVYRLSNYPCWALSRFEDVWNCSMDAQSFSVAGGTTPSQLLTKAQPVTPMINSMDPPAHTAMRAKLRPFFSPARVRELEPTIRQLFSDALDEMLEQGGGDLVGDFGTRVALKVASIVSGIPLEDGEMLYRLVQRFFSHEEGVDGMSPDGIKAWMEMFEYFGALAARRRAQGTSGRDPLDVLIDFEQDGRRLEDQEIASHMSLFLIGGSETFPKVFANLARRLFEHPSQRAAVAADPTLAPDAMTEALRFDMPTQFLGRTVARDVELHGEKLRAGEVVLFLYASANRDPREFSDPDVFDIARRPPRILSFGHGTHACLGIHTAKAEGRIALEELLRRDPDYEIDMAGAERLRTEFVQGFARLPVRLRTNR